MFIVFFIAAFSLGAAQVHHELSINKDPHSWALSSMEVEEAQKVTEGQEEVIVAVIDTGIDATHPDLKDHLWHDPKNTEVYGKDFIKNKTNPSDNHGHGTGMAGIIAGGENKDWKASGIAPKVKIMALRAIFSSDKEREKELPKLNKNPEMEALKFAIDHHAKIINMSFSGKGFSQQEESLIKKAGNAGILVVVSANNDNRDLDSDQYKSYPASYTNLPNMIVVGGIGKNNKKHYSSNFGKETVDVFAPGSRIKCPSINHEYRLIDGTSPAAALVSGVAALLFSANPKLTPEQVRLIIMSSAVRLPDLQGLSKTDATVNAKAALDLLKNYDNNSNKTIAAN